LVIVVTIKIQPGELKLVYLLLVLTMFEMKSISNQFQTDQ
jgi:hypothetical protein